MSTKTKSIQLKNGMVIFPKEYIVLESTITPDINFAGIVAEKNGLLPHFVVFSEKSISDFTEEEIEHVYDLCEEVYPQVKEIRDKQVPEILNENGFLVNWKEWNASPRLGLFAIHEVSDEFNLYNNTGIIRRKKL